MVVYKVVIREGDALWSASTRSPRLITRYIPYIEALHGQFPLFVFSTLYYALEYVYPLTPPFEIWEAEPSDDLRPITHVAKKQEFAEDFWLGRETPIVPALPGTMVCDWLTLMSRFEFPRT